MTAARMVCPVKSADRLPSCAKLLVTTTPEVLSQPPSVPFSNDPLASRLVWSAQAQGRIKSKNTDASVLTQDCFKSSVRRILAKNRSKPRGLPACFIAS